MLRGSGLRSCRPNSTGLDSRGGGGGSVADPQQNDGSNPLPDNELERLKMYQDSFKHMMTFCSGGILLSAAVTGALFPKPAFVLLLELSLGGLAVGVLAAMWGLYSVLGGLASAVQ